MSPVHVIVTPDPAEAETWASAFQGAVDIYRFASNVEAFERLTAAASPIDVVILMAGHDGAFDMGAVQLAGRLCSAPLATSQMLAGMQVVLVGASMPGRTDRVHEVGTLDAAIRLVKFGEVESAPAPVLDLAPESPRDLLAPAGGFFAGNVISSIWDNADRAAEQREAAARQQAAARRQQQARQPRREVAGGGATAERPEQQLPEADPRREAIAAARREQAAARARQAQPVQAAPQQQQQPAARAVRTPRSAAKLRGPAGEHLTPLFAHSRTAADAAPVAVAAQPAAVTTAPGLEPARRYDGPVNGYQGPELRGSSVPASAHAVTASMEVEPAPAAAPVPGAVQLEPMHAPQPPALTAQVQQLLYPSPAPGDPVLGFSTDVQRQLMEQQLQRQPAMMGGPAPHYAHPAAGAPAATPQYAPQAAAAPQQPGMIGRIRERVAEGERAPMMPNPQQLQGLHAGAPMVHHAPAAQQYQAPGDLMARAESGAASFG